MTNRSLIIGTLGVGAVIAAIVPRQVRPVEGPSAASAQARVVPQEPLPRTEGIGRQLMREFLGAPLDDAADTVSLNVLIATFPDPVASRLDWTYDALIEATLRAFGTAGYTLDRFWLPAPDDSTDVNGSMVHARDVAPGAFLFRRGARSLHLLYVVPEVPTAGVYKVPFETALDERIELLSHPRVGAGADSRTLRILGPTFSGSSVSVRRLLDGWLTRRGNTQDAGGYLTEKLEIISGSATSYANKTTLTWRTTVGNRTVGAAFRSTIHADESLREAFEELIRRPLNVQAHQVAILQETTTEYGQQLVETASEYLVMPFPINISRVRDEYERSAARDEVFDPFGGGERARVSFNLTQGHRPTVVPRTYSELTPAAIDLLLEEMVRSLRARDVRLVGILATDVRDKIFLAQALKRRLRDVQLFTHESNVLFLRDDRRQAMHGMLVLSTYPLFLDNQKWTGGGDRRLPFPNDGAAGSFNATLLHLGDTASVIEYRMPGAAEASTPPVWLTSVGGRAMVPVCVWLREGLDYVHGVGAPASTTGTSAAPSRRCGPSDLPAVAVPPDQSFVLDITLTGDLALIFLGLITAGVGIWIVATTGGLVREWRECQHRNAVDTMTRVRHCSLHLHEQIYRGLLQVATLGAFLPPAVLMATKSETRWFDRLAAVMIGIALVGGIVALVYGMYLARITAREGGSDVLTGKYHLPRWREWKARPRARDQEVTERSPLGEWIFWLFETGLRTFVALIGVVYFVGSGLLAFRIWQLGGESPTLAWLFYLRAAELQSGVSPMLPLILSGLGYAVWSAWHVRRVRFLLKDPPFEAFARTCFRNRPQDSRPWSRSGEVAARSMRRVRDGFYLVLPDRWALLFAAILFMAFIGPVRHLQERTLDHQFLTALFDWVLAFGIVSTLVATPWAMYRMLVTWRSFVDTTAAVARLPLLSAFDRLPRQVVPYVGMRLFASSPEPLVRSLAATQWIHLKNIAKGRPNIFPDPAPSSAGPSVGARVSGFMTAADQAPNETAKRLEGLYDVLRTAWADEPTPAEANASAPDMGDKATGESVVRFRTRFHGPLGLWLQNAEEYAALWVLDYITKVLQQIRNLAVFLWFALILTTALLSSYPYHARSQLKLVFIFVLLATVGTLILVMTQMSRDQVLSRCAKSTPGQVNWNSTFVLNVIIFGVVPLVYLVSSEFPVVQSIIASWLQPAIGVLTQL